MMGRKWAVWARLPRRAERAVAEAEVMPRPPWWALRRARARVRRPAAVVGSQRALEGERERMARVSS